jgi:hypothetical protein
MEKIATFTLSEFNNKELDSCHLLIIEFIDVPFTDLKFKMFLSEFKDMMQFISASTDISQFVMFFNLKNCSYIPITQTPVFIELIMSYQDMFQEKLLCTQAFIESNFMTIISNLFCKLYKTVKPFLFLKTDEIDYENIINIIKQT